MNIRNWFGLLSGKVDNEFKNGSAENIEEQYKTFLEGIEDGYYEISVDGRFKYFNNYFSRLTGYRPKDLMQRSLYDLLTEDCRQHVEETFRKIHRTGLATNLMEWTVMRRDGERRTFEASVTIREPLVGEDMLMRGVVRDITDRKETEEALILGNRAMSATNNGIVIIDPENIHTIINCNPAFEKITGYSRDEVIGKGYTVLYGPETDIKSAEHIRQAFNDKRDCRTVIRCYRKDEKPFWSEITFSPVRDAEGVLTHYIGIMNDLTDRVQSEYKLRESEERFRKLLENASDVISVISEDGTVLYESPAVERILGFDSAKRRVGQNIFDFIHPEDRDVAVSAFLNFINDPGAIHRFTFRMQRADGDWRIMESVGHNLLDYSAVHGIILNSRDVTERITAEEALRQSEERYRLFFEDDLTGDFIATPEGEIIACNHAFALIFGYNSVQAAMHTNLKDLYPSSNLHNVILGQLRKKKRINGYELELKRIDGKSVHIIENIVGVFDGGGNLIEIKGYMFDNTERKRLEQQLIQAQKMQSLGTLAAGVAHDFNNVLSIVDGSLSLVKPHVNDEALQKYISMGEMAVERGADVAGRLLTFARTDDVKIIPFDFNKVVNELTKVLNHTIDKNIVVNAEIDPDSPFIKGDRGQVYQMLLNLCINARDAILDPRRKSGLPGLISISTICLNGEVVREKFNDANDTHYLCIRVEDNGIGMSDSVRQQIFDPFFTTKPAGKGTGLGLSVVYGMVKSHSGYIEVESEEGCGTVFDIYLPALIVEQQLSKQLDDDGVQGGSETILVVEDEEMMLTIVSEMLRVNGYRVLQAKDGVEGLELFTKHQDSIGAVILDMGLPRMSGQDLFKRMKQINPEVRVVIASGFTDQSLKNILIQQGAQAYLQKPYKPREILSLLRKVFDPVN
jgi:PAS domain S-box-containing protein